MDFKKLHKWTEKEVKILKEHFHDTPFSAWSGSRWEKLRILLEKSGSKGVTEKAISRKCYRLGLRSYKQTHYLIEGKCHLCKKELIHKHRYKNPLCEACALKQKIAYSKTARGKEYHRKYIKNYNRR